MLAAVVRPESNSGEEALAASQSAKFASFRTITETGSVESMVTTRAGSVMKLVFTSNETLRYLPGSTVVCSSTSIAVLTMSVGDDPHPTTTVSARR